VTPSHEPAILLAAALGALVVSGIGPHDRATWWTALATLPGVHDRELAALERA
jgi:hypothetical protein